MQRPIVLILAALLVCCSYGIRADDQNDDVGSNEVGLIDLDL